MFSKAARTTGTRFTGEGFPNEKHLAIFTVAIGIITLGVIVLDYMQNSELRKVSKQLAEAQLKEINNKNAKSSVEGNSELKTIPTIGRYTPIPPPPNPYRIVMQYQK